MKGKNLMIGDWLQYYDCNLEKQCYAQVTSIQADGVMPYIQTSDSDVYYLAEEYKPIPLTSEILEGNGFERWKNDNPCLIYELKRREECVSVCVFFPKGYNTRYYKNWAMVSTKENHIEHCVCEYVHELQHAFRLGGIEKEIKL